MLTAYDATFARILDSAGIEILLIGDSLGMVIQGNQNTIPVTIDDIIYHTRCVSRVTKWAHIMADMPFMSYQASIDQALINAGRCLKEGGAESVKLEVSERCIDTVKALTDSGIPVMAHIGLRPQTVYQMGGYKIHGKDNKSGQALVKLAVKMEEAGAFSLLLEGITVETTAEITNAVKIPTIGISSGPHCDGQVLVIYDLLGIDPGWQPKFAKKYANLHNVITKSVKEFIKDVNEKRFPSEEHGVHRK